MIVTMWIHLLIFQSFTVGLVFKHLLWCVIFCASLSLQKVFLRSYYNLYLVQFGP